MTQKGCSTPRRWWFDPVARSKIHQALPDRQALTEDPEWADRHSNFDCAKFWLLINQRRQVLPRNANLDSAPSIEIERRDYPTITGIPSPERNVPNWKASLLGRHQQALSTQQGIL